MNEEKFYQFAIKEMPAGLHIVAINFHVYENRYVALLAKVGELYPFRGKIYEPIS